MSNIASSGTFHPRRPRGEAAGLRRHAARRPRRVRAAEGSRRGARRAARGGRQRRQPHRHQRLLRSAHHQPAHPRSAAPLSRRSGHRHQDRRAARRGWILDSGLLARGTDPGGARQSAQSGAGCARSGQPALHVRRSSIPRRGRSRRRSRSLAELQRQGLVRHIGLSNVTPTQIAEGRRHLRNRLRAEPLQSGASGRRRPDRRTRRRRHRLRAVLPARRVHAAAVRRPVRRRRTTRRRRRCRSRSPGCCGARPTSC